jgi:two-component system sensor histidine kinase KdpD
MSMFKENTSMMLRRPSAGYIASAVSVLVVALLLWPTHGRVNEVTVADALLIIVLLVAVKWGTGPAVTSSVLSCLCLNFYFVPPIKQITLPIGLSNDFIALAMFLVSSILVGQVSIRSQRRALEKQQLYEQLQEATEQKGLVEAKLKYDVLKLALLDALTHDLRTPLTSIKAAGTALIEEPESPNRVLFLRIIVQQADRLNKFIGSMLELAKVEVGNLDASRVRVPVEQIVEDALERAEHVICNHSVSVDVQDGMVAFISPDAASQVVYLLLDNAAKYSPAGTNIRILASSTPEEDLQIAVEDEGPGVPRELRERIFDKFFRQEVDSEQTGLGLGLAIARGIVAARGGQIWVEDRDGAQGARFVFTAQGVLARDPNDSRRVR